MPAWKATGCCWYNRSPPISATQVSGWCVRTGPAPGQAKRSIGCGQEASIAFFPDQPASDATIVGIVDSVHCAATKSKPARRQAERH